MQCKARNNQVNQVTNYVLIFFFFFTQKKKSFKNGSGHRLTGSSWVDPQKELSQGSTSFCFQKKNLNSSPVGEYQPILPCLTMAVNSDEYFDWIFSYFFSHIRILASIFAKNLSILIHEFTFSILHNHFSKTLISNYPFYILFQ